MLTMPAQEPKLASKANVKKLGRWYTLVTPALGTAETSAFLGMAHQSVSTIRKLHTNERPCLKKYPDRWILEMVNLCPPHTYAHLCAHRWTYTHRYTHMYTEAHTHTQNKEADQAKAHTGTVWVTHIHPHPHSCPG